MKKTKKFRLFTVLIALCMLVGTIPAYAVNPYGSLTLTFTSEEDIDLGGIEISVYQAAPATVTETYTLYNETFHSTVTTNQNGSVTFAKPSQYCSITVELDSLPIGFGISKQTEFFAPTENEITISISRIARADATIRANEPQVTLMNSSGDTIFANYTVSSDKKATKLSLSSTAAKASTAKSNISEINALTTYTYYGTIQANGFRQAFSESIDISNKCTVEKINIMYSQGIISEEELILYYCEIMESDEYSADGYGESVIEKLIDFSSTPTYSLSRTTSEATQRAIEVLTDYDDLSRYSSSFPVTVSDSDFSFRLHYDPTLHPDSNKLLLLANEMVSVYEYFVGDSGPCSFLAPAPLDGDNEYDVYLVTQTNLPAGADGACSGANGLSQIKILYSLSGYDFARAFSHEFHHGIHGSYGISEESQNWVKEAFVSMASLVYTGYENGALWFKEMLDDYLQNTQYSIFEDYDSSASHSNVTDQFKYGALIFPLYLYETFNGWATIKNIYINYDSLGNIYSAITNTSEISTCGNAFNGCAIRNYLPKEYYTELSTCSSKAARCTYYEPTSLTISMPPMSSQYHAFTVQETDEDGQPLDEIEYYSMEVTVTIDNAASGILINTINAENQTIHNIATVSRMTFTTNDIGSAGNKSFVIVPVNTNSNGNNITVSIAANSTS